jgi:leader peptidase (prepilin peptidase)/N-methyltransferase
VSWLAAALAAVFGLVFGSFFNVCIWRIPRGMSVNSPPSHCPRCRKPIRFHDNVPVLSWLLLRGRCRDCGQPISTRYPLVELLTGLLFLGAYLRFQGDWPAVVKAAVFLSLLVVMAFIDLDLQVIPFKLSIPGFVLGLVGSLLARPGPGDALLGAALGAAFVLVAWLLWRFVLAGAFRRHGVNQKEGMGWGDLPFAAMIGAFIGLRATVVALFVAVVLGVIVGLSARAAGRMRKGQAVAFGPFLALGGAIGLFIGRALFDWYVGLMLS